jgi:hypothetical protein
MDDATHKAPKIQTKEKGSRSEHLQTTVHALGGSERNKADTIEQQVRRNSQQMAGSVREQLAFSFRRLFGANGNGPPIAK